MDKDYYISNLEKKASAVNKALSFVNKHKKAILGGTALATGAGAVYAFGDDEAKRKMKTVGRSIKTGFLNGEAQDIAKNIGGLAGLGVSMAKGNSLGKSVAKGMLPGMAIGDIGGAAIIPTHQLYKKHKKEFGTAPDAKTTGSILAANVLPTVGVWGGIYGAKKALQGGKLNPTTIPANSNALKRTVGNLKNKGKSIASGIGKIDKNLERKVDDFANVYRAGRDDFNLLKGNDSAIAEAGGFEGVNKKFNEHFKKGIKSALDVGGAFAPVALIQEGAALPTYFATPENLIEAKKRRIDRENARG